MRVLLLLAALAGNLAAEPVVVARPEGKGPFPLLVIAPALRYAKDERIFKELAAGAVERGFIAVRYDWEFFQKGVAPSVNLSSEAAQLDAMVAEYRKDPSVDQDRIVIAAKSFGVKALMKSASKNEVRGLLLITPNCDEENTFAKAHAPLLSSHKRAHIVIAEHDPYCDVAQIRAAKKNLGPFASVTILDDGDHNFMLPNSTSTLYQDMALADSLAWLETQSRVEGKAKGLKRELCTVKLGMKEEDVVAKAQGREVSAEYSASLGKGDKMFELPVVKKSKVHNRCLVRTTEGKAVFIEATWSQDFATRYKWDEFIGPEKQQYGEPTLASGMQGKWERENATWADERTKMVISKSVGDATFYQVSIEDVAK